MIVLNCNEKLFLDSFLGSAQSDIGDGRISGMTEKDTAASIRIVPRRRYPSCTGGQQS